MDKKVELSAVLRINAVFTGEDASVRAMELVRKLRAQADRLMKEPGVSAVNLDHTTSVGTELLA